MTIVMVGDCDSKSMYPQLLMPRPLTVVLLGIGLSIIAAVIGPHAEMISYLLYFLAVLLVLAAWGWFAMDLYKRHPVFGVAIVLVPLAMAGINGNPSISPYALLGGTVFAGAVIGGLGSLVRWASQRVIG